MKANLHTHTLARALLVLAFISHCALSSATDVCAFDNDALSFKGTPAEQAKCLLRPVGIRGNVGVAVAELPAPLSCIGGVQPFSKDRLRTFLRSKNISESALGGSLDTQLAQARAGDPAAPTATYFVIHDTSTPNFAKADFPANIDSPEWKHNELARWAEGHNSKAHVFVNRVGESLTAVPFDTPWRATKLELTHGSTALKGLFLHIELLQPRRSDPRFGAGNDATAPVPGFTPPQYERLALLYIAASVRKGSCLIPAYHAVLDLGKSDGHDDPQNFSLDEFASAVASVRSAMERQ